MNEEKPSPADHEPDITAHKPKVGRFLFIALSCMAMLYGCGYFYEPPSVGMYWDRAGYAPETPVTIQLPDGSIFDVPAAYKFPWGSTEHFGKVNHWDSFSFNFWMPEKRFLEVNRLSHTGPRPQEKGRPVPERHQYVVSVHDFSIGWPKRFPTIQTQIKNRIYSLSQPINGHPPHLTGERRSIYGLIELVTRDDYTWKLFTSIDDSNVEVFFFCSKRKLFDNTLCQSDVYIKDKNYYFYLYLTGDQISQWRNVIDATIELVEKWKR